MSRCIGLHFILKDRELWNSDMFAGVCIANGCARNVAERLAADLEKAGERKTTVSPSISKSSIVHGTKTVGVETKEIAPRRNAG